MTARTVETAGEGGGDGDGLRGSTMNAPTQGVLGGIMAGKRPDPPSAKQKRCLLMSPSVYRIVRKTDVGRRPKAIRGIPVSRRLHLPWAR